MPAQIDDKPAIGGFVKARPLRRFTAAMNAACASRRAVAKADFVNSLGRLLPAVNDESSVST